MSLVETLAAWTPRARKRACVVGFRAGGLKWYLQYSEEPSAGLPFTWCLFRTNHSAVIKSWKVKPTAFQVMGEARRYLLASDVIEA